MQTLQQLRSGELNGVRYLQLCENLTRFPPEILTLKETLEVLDLSGNQLSELPAELAEFSQLRILFCSENRFTRLPEVLGRCPRLSIVGFKANRIREVPAAALPTQLRWLVLTNNEISVLPAELGGCHQLQKLMLAGNRLTSLPATLAACQSLELVRLSANRLTALPTWLLTLPRLSWLAFAGNPCAQPARALEPVTRIPWDALRLGAQLGEGASGRIMAAEWSNGLVSRSVAVKCFKGEMTSDGLPQCELAASLAAGRHPALIELLGQVDDHPQGIAALVMALITPAFSNLAGPPSLASCTRDVYAADTRLSIPAMLGIASTMASVAAHLHARGILHGDFYAHNILHDGEGRALLGDFGAASSYEPGSALGHSLERIEVRAFGCLLEELVACCDLPAPLRHEIAALVAACLQRTPSARPDFASLHVRLQRLTETCGTGMSTCEPAAVQADR